MSKAGDADLEVHPVLAGGFRSKLESQVNGEMTRAGASGGKSFSKGFSGGIKKIGGLGAALGIGKVIKDSVGLEASFSKTMSQVKAATGSPASAIDGLSKLAIKLGADTQFSANEASGAMLELGKSGISTSQIMGGALSGTLLLASAGSTDLATAATIASNAMNTFGLKGKDMAQIAAALAGGANASSASVESLGQGLAQVGPGAKNAGLSLQQTVGVLSAFDAAGIKGSDAGTSLKTMLSRLVPQTKQARDAMAALGLKFTDAEGSFLPITNVAQQLKDKLGPLSEAQRSTALTTIFGSDATRAATVLLTKGAKGIDKYIAATKDQNAAQDLAKANMSGTSGALERLSGAVETAELQLGQALAPTVNKLANFLSDDAVPAVTGFIEGMQEGTGAGGELVDKLQDIYSVGKGIVRFFDGLPGPVKKTGVEVIIAAYAIGKLNTVLAVGKTNITGFVTNLRTSDTALKKVSTTANAFGGTLRNVAGAGGMLALQNATTQTNQGLGALEGAAGGALTGFAVGGPLGAGIGAVAGGLLGVFTSGKKASGVLRTFTTDSSKAISPMETYAAALDRTKAAVEGLSRAEIAEELRKNGAIAAGRYLALTSDTVTKAAQGNAAAIVKVNEAISKGYLSGKGTAAAVKLAGALGLTQDALKANVVEANEAKLAVGKFNTVLPGLAKPVQKRIGVLGLETAEKRIVGLTRKYGLIKPQITTVLKAAGEKPTSAAIQRIIDKAAELNRKGSGKHAQINPSVDPLTARKGLAGLLTSLGTSARNKPPKVSLKVEGDPARQQLLTFMSGLQRTADAHPVHIKTLVDGVNFPGRAAGGPVSAGQPYIVGERRPEMFVPRTAGRIVPRVPSVSAPAPAATGGGAFSGPVTLMVGDEEFEAYMTAVAQDAVG